MSTAARHTPEQLEIWRRDGAVVLPEVFSDDEIAPVREAFEDRYREGLDSTHGSPASHDGSREMYFRQFAGTEDIPVDTTPEMNLLGLHPALIAFAREALESTDVRMYQCHTWSKFTGHTDYDQDHHYDFSNHTLTVPSDDPSLKTVCFIVYITDVTDDLGATHFVPLPDSDRIGGADRLNAVRFDADMQVRLREVERSGAAPACSVLAYGFDVMHRGTNLTRPHGHRFTITAAYKRAGNDMVGYNDFQRKKHLPWHLIIEHGTPEQLTCMGVPAPGDAFWTDRTMARMQERWPGWNPDPYHAAR